MGHNFGSQHDGLPVFSPDCPASDNHIMTGTLGYQNPLGLLTFSSCSIRMFKSTLLNSALTYFWNTFFSCFYTINSLNFVFSATQTTTNCLNTAPASSSLPIEVTNFVGLALPGQIFSPNDQCQQSYGQTSSFCQVAYLPPFKSTVIIFLELKFVFSSNHRIYVRDCHVEHRHLIVYVSIDREVLWKEQFVTVEK